MHTVVVFYYYKSKERDVMGNKLEERHEYSVGDMHALVRFYCFD